MAAAPLAAASVSTPAEPAAPSGYGPNVAAAARAAFGAPESECYWRVIFEGGINVRESRSTDSKILGVKPHRDLVKGRLEGDWLDLSGERGYLRTNIDGKRLLKPAERQFCTRPDQVTAQQLVEDLGRQNDADLCQVSRGWACPPGRPRQAELDLAEVVGLPGAVLGAILAGKCRDQKIPVTEERKRRFTDWMLTQCNSLWFALNHAGVGPEGAQGIAVAIALNDRFTSLDLSRNSLGDHGAMAIAEVLPDHRTLLHVDLSANNIGVKGTTAIFDSLLDNQSVTYLDLSSHVGHKRNLLDKRSAESLERLLRVNPVLARMSLAGTCIVTDCLTGIARGLTANSTMTSLDLACNQIGVKGALLLAAALGPTCPIEELNVAHNRIGDEGLIAFATKLGALPLTSDAARQSSIWPSTENGAATAGKYHDLVLSLRRQLKELSVSSIAVRDEAERQQVFFGIGIEAANLAASVGMTLIGLPRLRVFVAGGNNEGSQAGARRLHDALQVNSRLERIVLDQTDHSHWGGQRAPADAGEGLPVLLTALPVNSCLKSLSLGQCNLGDDSLIDLVKALALNQALEDLCLCGNHFGIAGAEALAALLGGPGPPPPRHPAAVPWPGEAFEKGRLAAEGRRRIQTGSGLKHLNLCSCHLEDAAGVAVAAGLARNACLEVLLLRNNNLGAEGGHALVDTLRGNTNLRQLALEQNGIDLGLMEAVRKLCDRNKKTHERNQPRAYSQKIGQLTQCKKSVNVLTTTLKWNIFAKRRVRMKQAAMIQGLKDAHEDDTRLRKELQARLDELRRNRQQVEEQISEAESRLQQVTADGKFETGKLQASLDEADTRIGQYKTNIHDTRIEIELFKESAGVELATLGEELARAQRARDSAATLAEATRANLGNFSEALRTIETELAGGMDPRQRVVHAKRSDLAAFSKASQRRPSQPRTQRFAAVAAANLTPRAGWK